MTVIQGQAQEKQGAGPEKGQVEARRGNGISSRLPTAGKLCVPGQAPGFGGVPTSVCLWISAQGLCILVWCGELASESLPAVRLAVVQ